MSFPRLKVYFRRAFSCGVRRFARAPGPNAHPTNLFAATPPFLLTDAAAAVGLPVERIDKRAQARLSTCLKAAGYAREQRMVDGVKGWWWSRPREMEPSPEEPEELR